MAKHRILCIHGVGQHADNWVDTKDGSQESFADQFTKLLKAYPALATVNPKQVVLHSIHYDDEILKLFSNWADQAANLKKSLASSPILADQMDWYTDAIDKVSAAKKASDLKFTHLMDLLLFVGSPSIQDRLVSHVGRQIVEIINTNAGDDFSLIAHSMGTSMAHKVIQALLSEGFVAPNGTRHTLMGDLNFYSVTMVANASYALSRERASHYDGIVRPSMTTGKGCCSKWINVNHRLDPVSRFMPFDYRKNPEWLDPRIESRGYHRDLVLHRISSPDIHSIQHYFRDPSFHIPFFELTFSKRFTAEQRDDAIRDFEKKTPVGQFKSLRAHLGELDVSNTDSFRDFFESLKAFQALVKQYA